MQLNSIVRSQLHFLESLYFVSAKVFRNLHLVPQVEEKYLLV